MARITYVKRAQQRYALVPKLNDDGSTVTVPYTRKDGSPKVTKSGRPVVAKVTVEDRSKPLPMPKCEKCGKTIEVGTPYKHVTPKTGVYGGRKRFRCGTCPSWKSWDLSNSASARCEQIVYDAESDEFNTDSDPSDMADTLSTAAGAIRELAEEKEASADSLEDGFQHATSQSEELRDLASSLNDWASEVENATIPDKPDEPEDGEPGDEPDEDDEEAHEEWVEKKEAWDKYQAELESWVDEVFAARDDVLGNSPA